MQEMNNILKVQQVAKQTRQYRADASGDGPRIFGLRARSGYGDRASGQPAGFRASIDQPIMTLTSTRNESNKLEFMVLEIML